MMTDRGAWLIDWIRESPTPVARVFVENPRTFVVSLGYGAMHDIARGRKADYPKVVVVLQPGAGVVVFRQAKTPKVATFVRHMQRFPG